MSLKGHSVFSHEVPSAHLEERYKACENSGVVISAASEQLSKD